MLSARVSAWLRRAYPPVPNADKAAFGEFDFDLRAKHVHRKGLLIGLTAKAFDLALLLFQHLGQLVSRKQVLGRFAHGRAHCPHTFWRRMS